MKKFVRTIPSIMLSVMLVFGMCAGFSGLAYADSDEPAADIIVAEQIADATEEIEIKGKLEIKADDNRIPIFEANSVIQKKSNFIPKGFPGDGEYDCYANMPTAGTLIIEVGSDHGASFRVTNVSGQGVSYVGSYPSSGKTSYLYNVSSPGIVNFDVTVSGSGGSEWMGAIYAAAGMTVNANTPDFVLGSTGSGAVSTINVSVPATGYLSITAVNETYTSGSVHFNTKGFKSWDYRSGGAPIKIGVKKGTYTISLKGAPYYGMSVKFTKVKETSAKTSKKKAAKIKKGKVNKGIIVTNKKKVHWYKIKNPKNQKMTLVFNTMNMSDGGSGYINITEIFPNGQKKYNRITAGGSGTLQLFYGTLGTKKAQKGTYYIKIESKGGTNGYYTMKWK